MSRVTFRVKFFLDHQTLVILFTNKATFWDHWRQPFVKLLKKNILEVKRNVPEKKQNFWKNYFWKKIQTLSQKFSADFKTAFVIFSEKCWGEGSSPQRCILFVPTLDSKQKTLGTFFKPVIDMSRAGFRGNFCFVQEKPFILNSDLGWKSLGRVVNFASFVLPLKLWIKTRFPE